MKPLGLLDLLTFRTMVCEIAAQGDPMTFFVPVVVVLLYLGFGTIYSAECPTWIYCSASNP